VRAHPVEFWFEFASTYSYPAASRIEAAAAAAGVPLVWRPFLLGPIFGRQGWNDSPFNIYPAKGRYMWRDLARICERHRLPLRRPSRFPRNGLLPARVALLGSGAPWGPAFVRAVYRANFAEDREISDPAVVAWSSARSRRRTRTACDGRPTRPCASRSSGRRASSSTASSSGGTTVWRTP
jgi:2-hydroxychromene-2-carboxylate isomerase